MNPRTSTPYVFRTLAAALLGVGLCVGWFSGASATTSSGPVKEIIATGFKSVNSVRSYFFCESTACKKDKAAAATTAKLAMSHLEDEASALQPSKEPTKQRPILMKFISDVKSLGEVFSVYASETTAIEVTKNTGLVYYESANVGSDIFLLNSVVAGSKFLFADWAVGATAVLYTMQVETQVISAKNSGVAADIAANDDLEQDSDALIKDANGPSQEFNGLLVTFAGLQKAVSKAENDILAKKKAPLSNAKLKSDIAGLSTVFTKIVNLQKTLSK